MPFENGICPYLIGKRQKTKSLVKGVQIYNTGKPAGGDQRVSKFPPLKCMA